jgi:beta-lactam-binding protein with PASTA domain
MAKDQIVEWGENNEVKFTFKYYFSDSIAKDTAIRQSISSGTRVEKGSSVTIDISIGPSVLIPDFSTMDKDEVSKWATDNSFDVVIKEIYLAYYSKGDYISQSIAKGKTVSVSSMIEVKFALGNPYINSYVGSSKYDFNDFVVSLNKKGTSITVKTKHEYSSSIAKHSLIYQSKENEKVELNEEITIIVSKGERYIVENVIGLTEEDARTSTLCQKMTCVFETIDNSDSGIPSGQVLSQSITTGEVVGLPEMITIKIKR